MNFMPVSGYLPPLVSCKEFTLGSREVFIHAPGFEDRTLASAGRVSADLGATAILLRYEPYAATNRVGDIERALEERRIACGSVTYNRFDPADFEAQLSSRLRELNPSAVTVDISTMSKLAVLLSLRACAALDVRVRIFYAEAETYGPSQAEFEKAKAESTIHRPSLQVFTGVYGVVRVDSLASVAMQGQPTAALVFMSLNDALTQVLLNTVYPGRLFLINGRPPKHSWREEATAWIHEQVRREWEEDNPVVRSGSGASLPARAASTLDYRETVELLLGLYWQLSATHRILLAPAGSKMQAVGSMLVKAIHPDIHIEYPSPDGFLPAYSSGVADCWMLDFGNLKARVSELADADRREHLEIHSRP